MGDVLDTIYTLLFCNTPFTLYHTFIDLEDGSLL